MWAALAALLITLLALYVFQVNSLTELAYRIAAEEGQTYEIEEQNKRLQISATQSYGLQEYAVLARQFGFEKIGRISYLRAFESAVAQNANGE